MGFAQITTDDVAEHGVAEVVRRLLARVGDAPVYVSVDIDVLDPAHAPGTGTPEAGGLTSRELLALVRGLRPAAVVGGDVVEVSPAYDHAEITAIAAAHVLYDLRHDHGGAGHGLTTTSAPAGVAGTRLCNSAFTYGKRTANVVFRRVSGTAQYRGGKTRYPT